MLDLSKVEAGKIEIYPQDVPIAQILGYLDQTFRPVAQHKSLELELRVEEDVPVTIRTDGQRLQQVLRNLIGNAFKFTETGGITVRVHQPPPGVVYHTKSLSEASDKVIAFAVTDTGIGIAKDKQQLIFEAFQQADGTTSRKYGGTGLGLSISRELARLLGGEVKVESDPGKGSTFTFFLPSVYELPLAEVRGEVAAPEAPEPLPRGEIDDDRHKLNAQDKLLLIIEDDPTFAQVMLDMARDKGFKGVIALRGDIGLTLARRLLPSVIILDLQLPVMDGLRVLEHLKAHPQTRHIPVHVMSGLDRKLEALGRGAVGYVERPASTERLESTFGQIDAFLKRKASKLLIVEDDERERSSMVELIGTEGVETSAVGSMEEALGLMQSTHFDCVVLDLSLKGGSGFELLERMSKKKDLKAIPVIVYTGRDLTSQEETRLKKYARSIIIKDARSPERLLAETTLFLHRVEAEMSSPKRKMLHEAAGAEAVFKGRKVLIVDDDVRNIYALATVLEDAGMSVVFAENGREGIEVLRATPGISIVLMDVMMPEMDGYETMRKVREMPEYLTLPILALTAKAMKGDREKCLAAGASDYVTKPVDPDQLLSLMRVWLYSNEN